MAAETRLGPARPPFDQRLSSRIDRIILKLEATRPKTIGRAWVRLEKRIAERHVPTLFCEVR